MPKSYLPCHDRLGQVPPVRDTQFLKALKNSSFFRKIPQYYENFAKNRKNVQCSPANPAQAGEEAIGLADLSGLPSSFCVLVGE